MKDKLKKPKALKAYACTIEQATLQLNPTVEKFEEELCETLYDDRLGMMGKTTDGTSVAIVERRLLVGALTLQFLVVVVSHMNIPQCMRYQTYLVLIYFSQNVTVVS